MLNLTNYNKGYDELIEIDGEVVYQVFAIKKNNGTYSTYYYTVPEINWIRLKIMRWKFGFQ